VRRLERKDYHSFVDRAPAVRVLREKRPDRCHAVPRTSQIPQEAHEEGTGMAGEAVRIVLLPRFTSLVGPNSSTLSYYSGAMNARAYCQANLTAWASGTVTLTLQESIDLITWSDIDTIDADSDQEVTAFPTLETEWVRVKATLSAGDRTSLWVVGEFVMRGT
jgi:hypothetical protein